MIMATIADLTASIIKDSLDNLTVEVTLTTDDGILAVDSVPTGVSRGGGEAAFVPAPQAVEIIEKMVKPQLLNRAVEDQSGIDSTLLKLDGTPTKERLGANTTLAVSLACARAAAKAQKLPLYRYLANLSRSDPQLPTPLMVMIEGGKHGFGNPLTYQEFLVVGPLPAGLKIIESLKNRFAEEEIRWNPGGEGGMAPFLPSNEAALAILQSVKNDCGLGLDIAASHVKLSGFNLIQQVKKYHLQLVEDPFPETDWSKWTALTQAIGQSVMVVGDDLVTTNPFRLEEAIKKGAANAIVIKPNQIGTLSETLAVAKRAKEVGWNLVVSHRAGETMDDFITDLAVGIGGKLLKAGCPAQKERLVKYQRLEAIAKELKE